MNPSLAEALTRAFASPPARWAPVAGGDINAAFCVHLQSGERLFVKTHPRPPRDFFREEAAGLAWLAEARGLRVPTVRLADDDFLALEWIDAGAPAADFDAALGRGLAQVHRFEAQHLETQRAETPRFGWARDNYLATLAQANAPRATWAAFYREQRLEPLLARAVDRGLIDAGLRRSFDRLFAIIDRLVGAPEPPARLHGDLWRGNVIVDERGQPCLVDPAVYAGHREIDLAMMRLFGGFRERCFAAYDEVFPLAAGAADRVALYQIYPLLAHVNLFGGAYVGQLAAAVGRYA